MRWVRLGFLLLVGGAACGLAGHASATIPDAEKAVLRDFYTSTGGDQWSSTAADFEKWFTDTDPCDTWYGVACDDQHAHVTGIALPNNNLTGSLPGNLAQLKQLAHIDVDSNRLTGRIPSLTGLTGLAVFVASYNQLVGPIPSLDGLASLVIFFVNDNQLSGEFPSLNGLSSQANVEGLIMNVAHNRLTGRLPPIPQPLSVGGLSVAVCPNPLVLADDPAWDRATASAPLAWWHRCDSVFESNFDGV